MRIERQVKCRQIEVVFEDERDATASRASSLSGLGVRQAANSRASSPFRKSPRCTSAASALAAAASKKAS